MKLNQGNFRLDIRERFFTETVVWLPREVVIILSLLEFKKRLYNTLTHMV